MIKWESFETKGCGQKKPDCRAQSVADCKGCEYHEAAGERYTEMMQSLLRFDDTIGDAYKSAKAEGQPKRLIRMMEEDRRNLKMAVALLVRLGVDMGFLPEPDGMMSTEDRKEAVGDVSGTD